MADIGERGSFRWIRPEHMELTGARPLADVRSTLSAQWQQCNETLDALSTEDGALCHITMSVHSLGKIHIIAAEGLAVGATMPGRQRPL